MKARRMISFLLWAAIVCLCACGAAPNTQQPTASPIPTPTLTPAPTEAPMWAEYASEDLLSSGGYSEHIVEDSEYTVMLAFHGRQVLTDISFQSLYFDGEQLTTEAELFHTNMLHPDTPLVVGVVFYGDMTTYGISFTTETGEICHYAISISGMDGSLIFDTFT